MCIVFIMTCLDILESKAFHTKPTVCKILMIDVTRKEIVNTTLNALIIICTLFLAVRRNQALRKIKVIFLVHLSR